MKLAIISHTEHYKTETGQIVGWGPTVSEINYLLDAFDTIYHVAMLHQENPPPSALPYISDRVKFVALKPSGGRTLYSKWQTIQQAPSVINTVAKTIKKVDCFQLRTPTGIAVYLIPYLTVFIKKKGWYKYAGNWNQKNPPFGYRLQRLMLLNQSRKVTINGSWDQQPEHCYTFENPCLTDEELGEGKTVRSQKSILESLQFCYVGRLEKPKGVERIINAFKLLSDEEKQRIGCVHMVGDGFEYNYFSNLAKTTGVLFNFHGFLPRHEVFSIYKQSHVFVMPTTASEGFPKVIAEAMNYGCLPIVSNISSIGHYLKHQENGFLLNTVTVDNLLIEIKKVIKLNEEGYNTMINNQDEILTKFTFSHYKSRILRDILK
ncbi:glycosyltransferase [Psychroserpens mesophilus]|uniref:glycosyltransferase n=1 Tax=Psychroserpens mesophilus TaxID=325473 RepID=UPI003D654162